MSTNEQTVTRKHEACSVVWEPWLANVRTEHVSEVEPPKPKAFLNLIFKNVKCELTTSKSESTFIFLFRILNVNFRTSAFCFRISALPFVCQSLSKGRPIWDISLSYCPFSVYEGQHIIRPPDIVCRRTYILPVFLLLSFFLSFFAL